MDFKSNRQIFFNTIKKRADNNDNSLKKTNFRKSLNEYLNLPLLTINTYENVDSEKDIETLKKQIFQNKININKKKKELQILKIQYNKLIKENRTYKKMIYEVLNLHDETKSNIEGKDIRENFIESSHISEEQLLNKLNSCKLDKTQEKQLQNSFEMLNLKEELSIKRKLLLTKRKEYDELKKGISLKSMNEMGSILETIRVNERKLQSEVSSIEERLLKNDEIIIQLQNEIKNEEKTNEEMNKQQSEYELKYNDKLKEMKEIEKDLSGIDNRRKIKINKITKNNKYEGSKLKGLKLKSKIFKIKNDINKIEQYENEKRDDLIKILEQRRAIVSELKSKNKELETKINDLGLKNTKLYVKVNENNQEKNALENRGKEQIKDIKRLKELEKILYELNFAKNKIIKEIEDKSKYLNNFENENDKKNAKILKKDDTNVGQNENMKSRNDNVNNNLEGLDNKKEEKTKEKK